MNKGSLIRTVLGLGVLVLGAMEYVFNRALDSTHLGMMIKGLSANPSYKIDIFGNFGGVMPDFAHPFCFALLTMVFFPKDTRKIRGFICLFWLGVDIIFEVGQFFGQEIALLLPKILPRNILPELLTGYFTAGTYDSMDVLAIGLGTTAAFVIGELTATTVKGGLKNDSNKRSRKKGKWLKTLWQDPVLETGN